MRPAPAWRPQVVRIAAAVGVSRSSSIVSARQASPWTMRSTAGGGTGSTPWRVRYAAAAGDQGGEIDRATLQLLPEPAKAQDVDQRVFGADLVQMDVLQVLAVDDGLGLENGPEDAPCVGADRRGKRGAAAISDSISVQLTARAPPAAP